ncbi:DUF2332 domain-containing protein [Microbacterium sp. JZ31]|uniref:DUF2332 domain-containing protein n=1 Tax=Microbacterium sp. JZ31 TaxID=1906274 RepID=UPI001931BAAE|nr:DUF2332 domain-containing protein [Microbacterium sp. JZ31]
MLELYGEVRAGYLEFARFADGASDTFAQWARAVAEDDEVVAWLGQLPPVKRQPNLVFAAARAHGVPAPGPYEGFRAAVLGDEGAAIRDTILTHATQTNEARRLATLLPALALAAEGRPLALIEIGASAGLCLLPDLWAYRWRTPSGEHAIGGPDEPELECDVTGSAPLPTERPAVAWRTGLDIAPIDVRDDERVRWLETLVWPEQHERLARLRAGVALARREPPPIVTGDLRRDLDALIDRAHGEADGAAVVVYHSAVIMYLDTEDRRAFEAAMRERVAAGRCHWVSMEASGVVPGLVADAPAGHLVLGIDGDAVASADQHGAALRWLR